MIRRGLFFIVLFFLSFGSVSEEVRAEALTLSQGLHLALQNNRDIKITEKEEAVSEADIYVARSKMLPSINASVNRTLLAYQPTAIFGPQSVPTAGKGFLSYGINVQQLLYDFEGSASSYKASTIAREAKGIDTSRVRNGVELDFALIYFDLLESEKLTAVAEKEAERLVSHLRDARSLYDEGVITRNDLLQAEVKLSDARQRLAGMKNMKTINSARLNHVLARPIDTEVEAADVGEASSDCVELDPEKAWAAAEKQRPEMRIIDAAMDALGFEERAKKAENYPSFFVQGGYDRTENPYQLYEGNWSLTVGMRFNLFSGGKTKAEVSKIEQKRLEIAEQKNKVIDGIRLEIAKYILDLKTAGEKLTVTKDAIMQAEENLRINKIRYEEGVGTATEVLDAVALFTAAETNHFRSVYDFKRAEAGLMYSMGRDLREVYK